MAVEGVDSAMERGENKSSVSIESEGTRDNGASNHLDQEEKERKARIDAIWKELNGNGLKRKLPIQLESSKGLDSKPRNKNSVPEWMTMLGMAPKKRSNSNERNSQSPREESGSQKHEARTNSNTEAIEDARKLAAQALASVKDAIAVNKGGKIEVSEVRNFAGQEVKLRKLVDANSKEAQIAQQKAKLQASSSSQLDTLIEQISKKQKLNILDKSKQDWGEFKEEKGLEEELDAYKKSSNQYLDKVSFLQRTELREFEKEREIRLAQQAKRRLDAQRDGGI